MAEQAPIINELAQMTEQLKRVESAMAGVARQGDALSRVATAPAGLPAARSVGGGSNGSGSAWIIAQAVGSAVSAALKSGGTGGGQGGNRWTTQQSTGDLLMRSVGGL